MSILEILHKLVLGPIELLFDVIFSFAMSATQGPLRSVILLSVAVNFLVLPLYRKADALQKEEQETAKRLKPRIDQIREAFSGDERFMILQTFYRQNHYKPYYVLRGSLSLLLRGRLTRRSELRTWLRRTRCCNWAVSRSTCCP